MRSISSYLLVITLSLSFVADTLGILPPTKLVVVDGSEVVVATDVAEFEDVVDVGTKAVEVVVEALVILSSGGDIFLGGGE